MTESPTAGHADETYLQLKGAQKATREAYFDADAGLYTLDSVPGSGKSTTIEDIAARHLVRRYAAGDPTPEQSIAVLSFNTEQGKELAPAITDRLTTLIEHVDVGGDALDADAVTALTRRLHQTNTVGTVDGFLREVFTDILAGIGFDEVPVIGADLHLQGIHAQVYADLAADTDARPALSRLIEAYPPGEYDDGAQALLRRGLNLCRQQCLSIEEFRDRLQVSVEAVYRNGPPADEADLVTTLDRLLDPEEDDPLADLDDDDIQAVIDADAALYTDWHTAIDAYITSLDRYQDFYQERIRETGIVSHADVAGFVADFFAGRLPTDRDETALRDRVRNRYASQLDAVIIDEAQDVSHVQHDALKHLIDAETRVLLVGDVRQSIYTWRFADPALFQTAIEEGRYFGRSWPTHVAKTTTTNYRSRPAVAAAIDAVCAPALSDADRGGLSPLDMPYPHLDPAREAHDEPAVHIAGVGTRSPPGTYSYVSGERSNRRGEAEALARHLGEAVDDGRYATTADDPSVLVLVRRRTHLDTLRAELEAHGLSVATAAVHLFETDIASIVTTLLQWVANPTQHSHLEDLLHQDTLGVAALEPALDRYDWSPTALQAAGRPDGLADSSWALLTALTDLQQQVPTLRTREPAAVIETIIDTIGLREDRYDIRDEVSPTQWVATCDALVEYVREATAGVDLDISVLGRRLQKLQESPYLGPDQPVVEGDDADVTISTIHQAKGEEANVVALADIGFDISIYGMAGERLVGMPDVTALAPPAPHAGPVTVDGQTAPLSPYGGLYTPSAADDPNTAYGPSVEGGIRWMSERWRPNGLGGHDHLQQAVYRRRAESFRLLYVALTRARDHLVLSTPLDPTHQVAPRERWLDTVYEGLGLDAQQESYTLDVSRPDGTTRAVNIAVNEGNLHWTPTVDEREAETALVAMTRGTPADLEQFLPRMIRPSTLAPLSADLDTHLISHFLNQPLHTESERLDPNLDFGTLDTETVGTIAHETIAHAIRAGLDTHYLRSGSERLRPFIHQAIDRQTTSANQEERDALVSFLTETVLPGLGESQLCQDIERADNVYVETPLRGEMEVDDSPVEIQGQADLLLDMGGDRWQVADIKVALAEQTTTTQQRYRLQVCLYAELFQQTLPATTEVEPVIETVGIESARSEGPWSDIDAQAALHQMLPR